MTKETLLAELQSYYPQMYALQFLEILDNHKLTYKEADLETATHCFLQEQGKENLQALILELECIEANEDWASFSSLILMLRGEKVEIASLQEMAQTIEGTYYAGMG